MIKWLKEYMFRSKLKNSIPNVSNNQSAQFQNKGSHICILFDESQIDNMSDLNKYIKLWTTKGKKVETFSYVDLKEFGPDESPNNKICRKQINWYNVPLGDVVKSFIEKPFDILITINPTKAPHLHFLNAASKAKFKIGLLPDEMEFYNLMIDCERPENVKNVFTDIQSTLDKLAI